MSGRLLMLVHFLSLSIFVGLLPQSFVDYLNIPESSGACELQIEDLVIGDCTFNNNTGNTSRSIVAVWVSWIDMNPGEMIICEFQGQQEFIDPYDISCPPFVTFIVTPDGSTSMLDVRTASGNCIPASTAISLPQNCDPPICTSGQHTGGKVYADYNGNGIQDASEEGLPNIMVSLYGNDVRLGQAQTGINGHWATDVVPPGQPVRIEFDVPNGLFDGGPGAQSHTRVQIGVSGTCNLDLGILAHRTFVDPDPWIATTCFAKGAILDSTSQAALEPTVVLNKYFTPEGGPRSGPDGNYYLANAFETGSIWGLAYQRETRTLYASAFLKRQAALGPDGLGAIYQVQLNDFFPTPPASMDYRYYGRTSLLLNLDDFGIVTGDEASLIRDLPATPNAFSHDSMAFDLIGKWGLGDMDISEDGDSLFLVNLHNQSLVIIDIGNPAVLPVTSDRVSEIPIPDPGCASTSDWRPWGLKYFEGQLYVGGVCSAESSQDPDDMWAHVYAWRNNSFRSVVDFNLNYPKGPAIANDCRNFIPWSSDFSDYKVRNDIICGPSPLLSDIEFDAGGHMVLGLGDRFGYQTGGRDYGPDRSDKLGYISFTAGDILRLHEMDGRFLLEKNANSGFLTSAGRNNNQGVCGGEYYYEDAFHGHQESILGALASHPSYNTILSTIMDPATIWSNGWSQFGNSTGQKNVNYSIFAGEIGTFGKAAGLGDIEIMSGSSRTAGVNLSIGNYIWMDNDRDGIQDPGEPPISNLEVVLYDENGMELMNTFTDNEGLYYFHDLLPRTNYYLALGRQNIYIDGQLIANGMALSPTLRQSRQGFGNRNNDSDGLIFDLGHPMGIQDLIGLNLTTGDDSENDFSFDIGLSQCVEDSPNYVELDICEGDSIIFMNRWYTASGVFDTIVLPGEARFDCDSVIYIEISALSTSQYSLDTAICPGEVVRIGGMDFDTSMRFGNVLIPGGNMFGCDSMVSVSLSILPEPVSYLDHSICPGEMVTVAGEVFDENRPDGQVRLPGEGRNGCDSLINVQLELLSISQSTLDTTLCPGEILVVGNETFDESRPNGIVRLARAGYNGCDSMVNVGLSYLQHTESILDTAICRGEVIVIGNEVFDENRTSGQVLISGGNQYGCDSLVTVNLEVSRETYGVIDSILCPGETLNVGGEVFSESRREGTVVFPNRNVKGCDSIVDVTIDFPVNQLSIQPLYVIEYGDSVRLRPTWANPFDEFSWTPDKDLSCLNCPYPWADPLETTIYDLSGIDVHGCWYFTQTKVVVEKEKRIWAPNVFTPDGDNINDFFTIYSNPFLEIIEELMVFDRWGEMVFQTKNIPPNTGELGWDGLLRAEPMNPAVFVFVAHVRWKDGERETLYGDVTLLR